MPHSWPGWRATFRLGLKEGATIVVGGDRPAGRQLDPYIVRIRSAQRMSLRDQKGTVRIKSFALNPDAPFGGWKESGLGLAPAVIRDLLTVVAAQARQAHSPGDRGGPYFPLNVG